MSYHLHTIRGYSFPAVSSAMQQAIRRGDAKLAGYWALELWASGFGQYVWRRLLTVSAEDCWGILTQEWIVACLAISPPAGVQPWIWQ
ncbi:MAG: hypothetical protein NTW21_21685 [Verrucomicrobia bacterium]|nr:hypothetical protein [Verrucomicrobiota bacterium]